MLQAFASHDGVERIVAVDRDEIDAPAGVEAHRLDLALDVVRLTELAATVDVVVHLAWIDPPDVGPDPNRPLLEAVLAAAQAGSVEHFVLVSSATVYGAWPNAALPIPEVTALRPNPTFTYATVKAEHERVVGEWRRATGVGVSVLRPAAAVGERSMSWLGNAIMKAAAIRAGVDDPPTQFVHVDDVASATVIAALERLDGPYNVAPDGWLPGSELRALLGPRPRLRLPASVAERLQAVLARRRRRPLPVGLLPYTMHPWVVANDRLRRVGWVPSTSNAEAFVEADQAPPWVALNAKQRQYASLGAVGVLLVVLIGVVALVVRRRRQRVVAALSPGGR